MSLFSRSRIAFTGGIYLLLVAATSYAKAFDAVAAPRVYPASGALSFTIHDPIDSPIYSWPRTLLAYPVDFSSRQCTASRLHLLSDAGQELPFQLSAVATAPDGHLLSAQLNFFADLPPGATRTFHFVVGKDQVQASAYSPGVVERLVHNTIEVTSTNLSLRLPASQSVPDSTPLPAPILAISRDLGPQQHWIGHNTITLSAGTTSTHAETQITTRLLESGNLFRTYEIAYRFSNGASNFFLSLFSGRSLSDTQCGLRRYPIADTLALRTRASGYAFEAEVILRSLAAGIPLVEHPVSVVYPPEHERVTHFDSVKDPARIVIAVVRTLYDLRQRR